MINNNTLYYPTIEFTNPEWLWSAALLWDRVYRIVPTDCQPKDSRNIKELIANSDFISDINPGIYSKKACEEFVEGCKTETWWAAALDNSNYTKKDYVKLHKDKADVKLREMILAKDAKDNNWMNVPHDMASIYMLFLANYIAKRNDISLSTDYTEAWCGSNFFQYDGNISDYEHESETQLACITINNFIPINIMDIKPGDLIKLREKRKEERQRFFKSIKDLSVKISACEDRQIIKDIFVDNIKEIEESKRESKKSMLDIKIVGWMGVKSLIVPALLPVMQQLVTMSEATTKHMAGLGLGIGVIGALWEQRVKIQKERKNYECDYLLQLSDLSSRNYVGNTRYNLHEGYQTYLNDNLNHFLRD